VEDDGVVTRVVVTEGHVSGQGHGSIWASGVFDVDEGKGADVVFDGESQSIFWRDESRDFLGVGLEFASLFGVITFTGKEEAE